MAAKKIQTARHGGYVTHGVRTRKTVEMYVEIDVKYDVSDCGRGTDHLVKALKDKAVKRGLKNVEVREVW